VGDAERLVMQVVPMADSDAEELADLAGQLHAELLGVDDALVGPLPAGAKGWGMSLAGW
jgi:hypothetical protein